MDIFDSSYFRLNKILMTCSGQWPYQSTYQRIIISVFFTTMISSFLFTLICGIVNSNNFDESMNMWSAGFVVATCLVKLLNSIIHSKKRKYLLEEIKSDWKLVSGPEVDILNKFATTGRKLSLIFAVYVYLSLGLYFLSAYAPQLLNIIKPLNETRLRKRTYESKYFVDEHKYYYYITFHEHIALIMDVTILIATDTMYVVYTEHICGMFAILRFAEMLDSVFSVSLFLQVGFSMICIAITGYVTLSKLAVLDEFFQFFVYIVAQLVFIFYTCLPGQKIIDASENIVNSHYNSQWYRMPLKIQKLSILLMVRSSRPCCFRAAGIFVLSLQTFSVCIQRAVSFFTVLLKVKE